MKVQTVPIAGVVPYARNPRKNLGAVAKVAASLREFGWRQPIVVDSEMVVVVGHTRLLAAQQLGMSEVPIHIAEGLTANQIKAYRLADNRVHEEAEWDDDLLALEIADLRDAGLDLALTGFDDDELARLTIEQTEGLTDADDVPDAPAEPATVLGDVWLLGRHRLVCGDSTTVEAVDACLAGVKPHLMVTDPPYGVEYDPNWQMELGKTADGTIQRITSGKVVRPNPKTNVGAVKNDHRADWTEAWALFPGDVAYVWHADRYSSVVAGSLESCQFHMRNMIVWAKSQLVMSRGNYHSQHEPCWYAVRDGKTGHWAGDRKQTTLWMIDKPRKSETGHGTQKPVECMKRPIENNSNPGQAVYEPFSGSGTTIIAAEMTGRACHAIELSPQYVDVAVRRWQQFTGQTAKLERTGETFDEIAARTGAKEAA